MKKMISLLIGAVILTAVINILNLNTQAAGFDLAGKQEAIIIASLPASTSPSLIQLRANAMAGMVGMIVPTDRTVNPAAWYVVPDDGLQAFDGITTSFGSWMGKSNTFPSERGHRIVVHVSGKFPVSKYWVRVTVSAPPLVGGYFAVGTASANGSEIPFGPNFVGIDFGSNGKLDSTVNPSTGGVWQRGGDDVVFDNGQLPSQVTYTVWYRFGSTTSTTINDASGFSGITAGSLKAELVVREGGVDTIVVTKEVKAARPKISISKTSAESFEISIVGGQFLSLYEVLTSKRVEGPWTLLHAGALPGQVWSEDFSEPKRFFQLRAVSP